MLLQQILKRFQDKEVLESLSGNLFHDRVAQGLGDFLIASSLALSRAQEAKKVKARMAELEEELSLKNWKALYDKSHEDVQLEA